MPSKKPTDNKKDKNIHKTAKSKSPSGKAKQDKDVRTTGPGSSGKQGTSKSRAMEGKDSNKKEKSNSTSDKKTNEKTLIIDDEEMEGMTVPPTDQSSSPRVQGRRPEAQPGRRPRVQPAQEPSSTKTPPRPTSAAIKSSGQKPKKPPPAAKSPTQHKKKPSSEDEEEEEEEEEEEATVKQFSFPAYKILSGASVAPVQIHPQQVVINPSDDQGKRHWGSALTGLFQNSKLTLKLRMLRLLLIWIFFRVLNKQTAWLSDMLGIGLPDEEPPGPKVKPPPGERYVKVFYENSDKPFHVRVKRPL